MKQKGNDGTPVEEIEAGHGESRPFDPVHYGIRVVSLADREFYLLGTAHVSADSVQAVEETIAGAGVDHVCIEIDERRYRSVSRKRDWSQLNIFEVIKRRQAFLLLSNLVLSSFQRRMGQSTGVVPGAEMIAAVNAARAARIDYSFGDRPVQATLRRAWAKTGLWGKNKLLASMIASAFSREKITEEDLAKLRQQNELETMLRELADYLPSVKEVLIDERDQYLAQSIWETEGKRVLAVVGAGHVAGIVQWLERIADAGSGASPVDKGALEVIPPPGPVRKLLPYLVPAAVAGLIMWGFFRGGVEGGLQSLWRWILVNGTLSGVGSLIALAHPVTIVASFAAAPITSMNPTIGVGFVTGLLEAFLRKPRVEDFENLNNDILSLRGVYRNRLTRILMVFLLSTVGSAVGTFVALPLLFPA
ncbi:MAG: TraB/GumN family protein [Spirochaetales bacterium]|nr:TraB/GumN family protein [Spirochaetales bacterium]